MNNFAKGPTIGKLEAIEESLQKVQRAIDAVSLPANAGMDISLQIYLKKNVEGAIENVQDIIEQAKYIE